MHLVDLCIKNPDAIKEAPQNKVAEASQRRKTRAQTFARLKPVAAALMLLLLLVRSEAAVAGGQRAMRIWCASVAPSLFPFLALMPMLVSDAARAFYQRAFGRLMAFFSLPASAAPALLIGLVAGSPAGALAARRVARGQRGNREFENRTGEQNVPPQAAQGLALAVCGMSPAYLVIGVGQGLFGSTRLGWRLALAQLGTQLTLLFFLRRFQSDPVPRKTSINAAAARRTFGNDDSDNPHSNHRYSENGCPESVGPENVCPENRDLDNRNLDNRNFDNRYSENNRSEDGGLKRAVESLLSICGYMVLFGSASAAAASLLGERLGLVLLALCDVTGGLAGLARWQAGLRFVAVGATVGFGGLCIAAQNVDVLRPLGVDLKKYLRIRILAALLCACLFGIFSASFSPAPDATVQNARTQRLRIGAASTVANVSTITNTNISTAGRTQKPIGTSKCLGANAGKPVALATTKQEYHPASLSAAQKEVSTSSVVHKNKYLAPITAQEKSSLTVSMTQDHMLKPMETYAFSLLFAAILALPALFLCRKS